MRRCLRGTKIMGHYKVIAIEGDGACGLPVCTIWRAAWWARRDLNPQPRDYESPALTVELQALQ